jgi:hypothetical protein
MALEAVSMAGSEAIDERVEMATAAGPAMALAKRAGGILPTSTASG